MKTLTIKFIDVPVNVAALDLLKAQNLLGAKGHSLEETETKVRTHKRGRTSPTATYRLGRRHIKVTAGTAIAIAKEAIITLMDDKDDCITRDVITEIVGDEYERAGYKRESVSSTITDLIRRGLLVECEEEEENGGE